MMVTQALTIVAAALAGSVSASHGAESAPLNVTATVVRPAEFLALPASVDRPFAIIRNAGSIDVASDGGSVRQVNDETFAIFAFGANPVTVTLTF